MWITPTSSSVVFQTCQVYGIAQAAIANVTRKNTHRGFSSVYKRAELVNSKRWFIGKVKGAGKDARVKDLPSDKRVDDKGAKGPPGATDEKDKKSKVKIKKIKDTFVSSGDPDLDDAEIRYFDVIRKVSVHLFVYVTILYSCKEDLEFFFIGRIKV